MNDERRRLIMSANRSANIKAQIIEFTLAEQQSTDVLIGELSDDAYAHIDDTTFAIFMYNTTPSQITIQSEYFISVQNNSNYMTVSSGYVLYGVGIRRTATAAQVQGIYYPPNSTDNVTSIGGGGKFFHNGKNLYYKSAGFFMSPGTYHIVITW